MEAAEIEDVFLGFVPATQVSITGKNFGVKMARGAKPLRDLVDLVGIEPTTSSMPWKRAPSCATGPFVREAWQFSAKPYFIFAYWGMGVKLDRLQSLRPSEHFVNSTGRVF